MVSFLGATVAWELGEPWAEALGWAFAAIGVAAVAADSLVARPIHPMQALAQGLRSAGPRRGMTRRAKRAIAAVGVGVLAIGGALAVLGAGSTDSESAASGQPTAPSGLASAREHGPMPWIIDAAGEAYCAENPTLYDEYRCWTAFGTGAAIAAEAANAGGIDSGEMDRSAAQLFPDPDESVMFMDGVTYVVSYVEDRVPHTYPEYVR